MSQFVIEMTAGQPSQRPGQTAAGDAKFAGAGARSGAVRSPWPFLVNTSAPAEDKQPPEAACNTSSFAS